MKYCVLILSGLSDRSYGRIKNLTPLEIARVKAMSEISSKGRMGMVKTIPDDMPPESLVSIMSILGYDPVMYYTGPAAMEARSLGIPIKDKDWCFCCDLVSTFDNAIVDPTAGQIRNNEASLLIEELKSHLQKRNIQCYPIKNNHHLLVFSSHSFSGLKTHNPMHILGKSMQQFLPQGEGSGMLQEIMQEAHGILNDHEINHIRRDLNENPADSIWIWGGSTLSPMPAFQELFSQKAAMITASLPIQGFAKEIGIDILPVPGITGGMDTNYSGKAYCAIEATKNYDIVFLHLNALVEASYQGDITQKTHTIEKVDESIVAPFLEKLKGDYRIMIVGGYFVSVGEKTALPKPVPFAVSGTNYPVGTGLPFTERNAIKVDFRIKEGESLLSFLIKS
ncbi:MAG: hypothetical protein HUU50_18345 [Candidatus Brocadiae bacterium]|nr:hypothetical protein [Candidatus Brocadiia bacterium]